MNPSQVAVYAEEMVRLADSASQAEPITSCEAEFTVTDAYAVSCEAMARRERSGWRRVGRKIGFTNRKIWDQYGVYEPIFGYMYEETVRDAHTGMQAYRHSEGQSGNRAIGQSASGVAEATSRGLAPEEGSISLAGLCQPLIEPEIVFGLRAPLPHTDDPVALLGAVEWVGHGFEVVQCHFPEWKFEIADTIADGGLHGRYVVGPRFKVEAGTEHALAEQLASFTITLLRDGEPAADGGGELVLGSPLNALRHLVDVLESLPAHPRLEAGELVTTGTLTTALPIAPGQTWSTRVEGLGLPGFAVRFE
jgi:2-oxo-3-hexenedioate decarboxylase